MAKNHKCSEPILQRDDSPFHVCDLPCGHDGPHRERRMEMSRYETFATRSRGITRWDPR